MTATVFIPSLLFPIEGFHLIISRAISADLDTLVFWETRREKIPEEGGRGGCRNEACVSGFEGIYSSDPIANILGIMVHSDFNGNEFNGEVGDNMTRVEPIWKFGLKETIFGARGIPKMSHLWLPLAVLFFSIPAPGLKTALNSSLPLILAVLCKVQFSILSNDLGDRGADFAVGKRRWIASLPKPEGYVIVILFLVVGLAAVILGNGSAQTILAYTASALLGMSYSLKPLRFKERGVLGPLAYMLSALMIYVLVPWTWFDSGLWQLIFLAAAVGSDKWVQVHFHQVVDYPADVKSGTRTYAVRARLERARSSLKTAAGIASFCLLSVIAYIIVLASYSKIWVIILLALTAATIIAVKIYTSRSKHPQSSSSSALTEELPWIYLGLTYLVFFVLPPVLFFFFALKEPWIWILVALAVCSAAGTSRQSLRYQYK